MGGHPQISIYLALGLVRGISLQVALCAPYALQSRYSLLLRSDSDASKEIMIAVMKLKNLSAYRNFAPIGLSPMSFEPALERRMAMISNLLPILHKFYPM